MLNKQQISKILLDEKCIILDTETLVGLSCLYTSTQALLDLCSLKNRPNELLFSVLTNSLDQAMQIGLFDACSSSLLTAFAPLCTVIVEKNPDYTLHNPLHISSSIGIRLTNTPDLIDIIDYVGQPIISTSANISGLPPAQNIEQALSIFDLSSFQPESINTSSQSRSPSILINTTTMKFTIQRSYGKNIQPILALLSKHNKEYEILS